MPGRPVTLGAMYDERSVTSFQALFLSAPTKKKDQQRREGKRKREREREREGKCPI